MSLLELLAPPPQFALIGWIILGLFVVSAIFQGWLAFNLWRQNPPSEDLNAKLRSGRPGDSASSNWFLRAAWAAKATLDSGPAAACDSGVEAVAQSVSAITILLRAMIGLFVLLGLLGTIYGLSDAVQNLLPTLQAAQKGAELNSVIESLLKTLTSLGSAFRITLSGLVPTIALSLAYGFYAYRLECKFARIKDWLYREALPILQSFSATGAEAQDPYIQLAALMTESRQEISQIRAQTEQFLAQWRGGMNQIAMQVAESVKNLQTFAGTISSLAGTTERLNEAASRVGSLMQASQSLGAVGDRLTSLADTILQTTNHLQGSTASFNMSLTQINRSIAEMAQENASSHQRFMDRNNVQVAALDAKFAEWKTQQEQIATDLNKVLTTFDRSSRDYVDVLTQTKTTLLDTAGLAKMIKESENSLREWQMRLDRLHATYRQAIREGMDETPQDDTKARRRSAATKSEP